MALRRLPDGYLAILGRLATVGRLSNIGRLSSIGWLGHSAHASRRRQFTSDDPATGFDIDSPCSPLPARERLVPANRSAPHQAWPLPSSVMDHDSYLTQLTDDSRALDEVLATADLECAVRSCPGWLLSDLAHHVAEGYQDKIVTLRTGHRPATWPPEPSEGIWLAPVREFLTASRQELFHELSTREPAQSCWTWYPEDQTVGFWARRMAQETVIHLWDAQDAVARPSPIGSEVAADGIDELLVVFLSGDWSDEPQPGPYGTLDVATGDDRWRITLAADSVAVERLPVTTTPPAPAEATIAGSAEDLLLGLWGRRPLPAGTTGDTNAITGRGNQHLIAALESRLALVCQ